MNTYTKLKDKHKGETCFILGAGPSLYDLCKSSHFEKILNHVVISVNSAFIPLSKFELNSEKHYWVSNDVLCKKWSYWKDVDNSKCTKVVRDSWLKYREEMSNTYFFSPRPTSEDIVNPNDIGLCYCSSIPTSIDLAIFFGCNQIFLFGVDQNNVNGRHYFWQLLYDRKDRPTASNPLIYDSWEKQNKVFEINNKAYKALRKLADFKNAEVYNCSNITKVTSFDRVSIDYVFKLIKNN